MKKIVFFSNNKNKIIEISNIFFEKSLTILNLNNFKKIDSPNEVGSTFEENAKIKSLYGYKIFNKICFADDSGICVEALGGKPGVYSKKFLKKNIQTNKVFKKIQVAAKDKNNFNAFFQTSICLSLNEEKHVFFATVRSIKKPGNIPLID